MFVLTKISDLIRLDPQNFNTPLAEGLEDEINKKFANKVSHFYIPFYKRKTNPYL